MSGPRLTERTVIAIAESALRCRIESAQHVPVGWGNENWRIVSDADDRFVVKFGPPEAAAKWSATRLAYQRAEELGVPAPRLLHFDEACAEAAGRVVRIFTWIDGLAPDLVLGDRGMSDRFFTSLGAALNILHAGALPAFSSRLDGSAPSFHRWDTYVAYRLPQIVERTRAREPSRTRSFAPTRPRSTGSRRRSRRLSRRRCATATSTSATCWLARTVRSLRYSTSTGPRHGTRPSIW